MIFEFSFSNFRSYKSETTIDFTAKSISEFEETLIQTEDGTHLLPVCVIYGPNGGGKTSVLQALRTFRDIVIAPLIQMAFMKKKNEKLSDISVEALQESLLQIEKTEYYYKWDEDSRYRPTKFSILFQAETNKYRYELALKNDTIVEENLFCENLKDRSMRSIFERDDEGVYLSQELEGVDISKMNEGLPILSYISLFKDIDVVDEAVGFFLGLQVINFDKPSQDRKIMVRAMEEDKDRIIRVVNSMGIDIADFRIEYDNDGKVSEIYMQHALREDRNKELTFSEESSGTRKIFSILPIILSGIDKGRLFVIDELDAKLHPVLLQKLIELFSRADINKSGAQLLFTSHDLTTMSNEVFRRDEIWFSAINEYDESVLYSLVDFRKDNGEKPRKDENYNKQYLEGRYGADPYMRMLQGWEVTQCL